MVPKRLSEIWPEATLNHTTAPEITQMEVILQSEDTVCTIDVLSRQQWPGESKSINEAWDIVFQSLPLPFFCHLCAYPQLAISLQVWFLEQFTVMVTEVYRFELLLASLSSLMFTLRSSSSGFPIPY